MKFVAAVLFFLSVKFSHAQSNSIFGYQIGTEIHRENFNGKGKLESRSIETILRCDTTSEGWTYVMIIKKYSADNAELSNVEGQLRCKNGTILIDMATVFNMQDNNAYKWSTESEYLQIPPAMHDGQTLPDASVTCTVIKEPRVKVGPAGSVNKSDMGARVMYGIRNRRVTSSRVTTPAGEVPAFKVVSDVTNESDVGYGYKIEMITHEWYVQGAGLVRSEVFNKKGKRLSHSQTTKRIK